MGRWRDGKGHHFGPHSRSYCTGGALLAMDAKGAQMTYLKRSRVRLPEVTVTAQQPTLWKWHISEHDLEIMHGYETSPRPLRLRATTRCSNC